MELDIDPLENIGLYRDLFVALGIFLVFVLFSWLTRRMLKVHAKKLAKFTTTSLDDEILEAVKRPLSIGIVLLGAHVSINSIPMFSTYSEVLSQFFRVVLIVLLSYTCVRVLNASVGWYMKDIAAKTESTFDDKYIPLFRKIISIIIYLLTGLLILGELGIEITPLIASLGIGGLAVALALQDTLANFFAGAYIVADKPLKPGDYISFEGNEGYVLEVGWRSTRIKTLRDSIVVVPNSKITQSIITNYYLPTEELTFTVPVGVSYDSDLEKVEKVTLEAARKILKETPGGAKNFEPVFRYAKFGEYSIEFTIVLKAEKFVDKFPITHEFIKALKTRFDKEGIEIPYPTKTIHMKEKQPK